MENTTKNKIFANNPAIKTMFWSSKIVKPKRDWRIILAVSALLLIFVLGFDLYMYEQIASGEMYVDVSKADLVVQSLKKNDLQKILDNFEAKKVTITTLKVKNLVDPSL